MDKYYNDKRNVFSSTKFSKNNEKTTELFVDVPKLKSYRGMFKLFLYFSKLNMFIILYHFYICSSSI